MLKHFNKYLNIGENNNPVVIKLINNNYIIFVYVDIKTTPSHITIINIFRMYYLIIGSRSGSSKGEGNCDNHKL